MREFQKYRKCLAKEAIINYNVVSAGADPGFPVGVGADDRAPTYDFAKFFLKKRRNFGP